MNPEDRNNIYLMNTAVLYFLSLQELVGMLSSLSISYIILKTDGKKMIIWHQFLLKNIAI